MSTTIIGVDLGLDGAIAILDDAATVHAMPVIKVGKSRKVLDKRTICELVVPYLRDGQAVMYIENLAVTPGMRVPKGGGKPQRVPKSAKCATEQGDQRGFFTGVCMAHGAAYRIITWKEWGGSMLRGMPIGTRDERKRSSIIIAGREFAHVSLLPTPNCTKKSDGMSDALLIALHARRLLNGGGA